MSDKPSRREFLKSGAALAASISVLRSADALSTEAPNNTSATPLSQFDYKDVQLLDGPMLTQFQHNHQLFLNMNEDSILKPFRELASLPAPG